MRISKVKIIVIVVVIVLCVFSVKIFNSSDTEYTVTITDKDRIMVLLKEGDENNKIASKHFAFEDLYRDDLHIATHSDLKDKDQSNKNSKEVKLTDKVTYENLTPNQSYSVKRVFEINGKKIEGIVEFTPTKESGTVNVN